MENMVRLSAYNEAVQDCGTGAIGRASIRYCVSDLPVDKIDYSWNGVYVCVHSD